MSTLRVATAGSVDDGKSTLIGRLLLDADALFADQISHVAETSKKRGRASADLSLVTDGLRAEREQGITIDVAWRYAATARRRFILADAPGHVQYTRNTLTAASTADALVILVDATRIAAPGDAAAQLLPQTKRHLAAGLFLGVRHLAVAINKMDEVGFSLERFAHIRALVLAYVAGHPLTRGRPASRFDFFPVSALDGDNVVRRSERTPWFDGQTLLAHLESVPGTADLEAVAQKPTRFCVQWVRRTEPSDRRGYAGRLIAGQLRVGDRVRLPSGATTSVASLTTLDGDEVGALDGARTVTVTLADELDVSRGDVLVHADDPVSPAREVTLDLAWVGREPLRAGAQLLLKHGAKKVRAVVTELEAAYDVERATEAPTAALCLNDFGRARVRTSEPLLWDGYASSRAGGRAILIGKETADTVAAAIFPGV